MKSITGAILTSVLALSAAQAGAIPLQCGSLAAAVTTSIAAITSAAPTSRYTLLVKALADRGLISKEAIKAIIGSPNILNPKDFIMDDSRGEETHAYGAAADMVMLNEDAIGWDATREELRKILGETEKKAENRERAKKETAGIFKVIPVKKYKGAAGMPSAQVLTFPDGRRYLGILAEPDNFLLEVSTGAKIPLKGTSYNYTTLTTSKGRYLIASLTGEIHEKEKHLNVFDVTDPTAVKTYRVKLPLDEDPVTTPKIAFEEDAKGEITVSMWNAKGYGFKRPTQIFMWNPFRKKLEVKQTFTKEADVAETNGRLVTYKIENQKLTVKDIAAGKFIAKDLKVPATAKAINDETRELPLHRTPDGREIVYEASERNGLDIWDLTNGTFKHFAPRQISSTGTYNVYAGFITDAKGQEWMNITQTGNGSYIVFVNMATYEFRKIDTSKWMGTEVNRNKTLEWNGREYIAIEQDDEDSDHSFASAIKLVDFETGEETYPQDISKLDFDRIQDVFSTKDGRIFIVGVRDEDDSARLVQIFGPPVTARR